MKPPEAFLIVAVLFQLVLLVAMRFEHRRQKALQDELVGAVSGLPFWRVAVARPEHLRRLLKLSAVQALGILVDEGQTVRIRVRWNASQPAVDIVLPKTAAHHPVWKGRLSLLAGNFSWAEVSSTSGNLMITAGSLLQPYASREALADILRAAFPGMALPAEAAKDFSLDRNPWSVAAIMAMFGLFFFAALDTYVFSRYELIDAQLLGFARDPLLMALASLFVIAAAWASYKLLRRGAVPATESGALAALVAAAAALALVPALKRADQLTASAPAMNHPYRVADHATTLKPVDATKGLPTLRFKRAPEYWQQFPVGSEVNIPLLSGGLGLWQLDHDRFDPPIMQFYRKHGTSP